MSQYKELADKLEWLAEGYWEAEIRKAIAILRGLDAQEPVMVYHGGLTGNMEVFKMVQPGTKLYAAPVAAQPQQAKPLSDAEFAINMLEMMFTAYENGTPCYEDPDDEVGFMGYAFRLADDDFKNIGDFLNRVRPVQSGIKEQG